MPLLGLYRSRLCIQRRREISRIAVACVAGAVTFGVVKGAALGDDYAVIVAAGSCILALMVLRWAFGQWLGAQRVRGRYRRGIVMVGTDEDAVDVWRMLHSQPELGYEVRGIIGEPTFCPEWATLPNDRSIDGLPDLASKTESTGVLVVANALVGDGDPQRDRAELGSRSARADLPGVSRVGHASGPACPRQWRGLSLCRTGTAQDLAIGGETYDRRDRSRHRPADSRSDSHGGLDRHPDRRQRTSPVPANEDRAAHATVRRLQDAEHVPGRRNSRRGPVGDQRTYRWSSVQSGGGSACDESRGRPPRCSASTRSPNF